MKNSTLLKQIKADKIAHGNDWSRPGLRAIAVYRFGVWRMGIKSKLIRAPFSWLYRRLFHFTRNVYGIEVPYSARIGKNVVFEHQGGIVIHGNASIGDGCIIRQGVTIGNRRLDLPDEAPDIGNNVNIGAGSAILGAVSIGDNAIIGANAVVLSDVPAGHMALGIPAKSRPLRDKPR